MAMNNGKNEKKNGLGLAPTKGNFQMIGTVSGCDSERFYTDTLTKTNKPRRVVNFAVQFNKGCKNYVEVAGMEKESVYAVRRVKGADGKSTSETMKIDWRDRRKPLPEGYRMLGVTVGVEQRMNEKGINENVSETLSEFDAADKIANDLKDDMSVFVSGAIEYSTYNEKHYKKFAASQVSRMKKEVDFEDEEFKEVAKFMQRFVYTGIEQPDKSKQEWIINGLVIGYNSVENAQFYVVKPAMANGIAKKIKPYTAMTVSGFIRVVKNMEETESAAHDDWLGNFDNMQRKTSPTEIHLEIDGIDPDTLDSETYTEASIDAALAKVKSEANAKRDYGDTDNDEPWTGNKIKKSDFDEDDFEL